MSTSPEDMDSMLDDESEQSATPPLGGVVDSSGGLSALDIPGAAQAMQRYIKSSGEARAALQRAREQIVARRYNRALPWFAASQALAKPTRTGAFGEVMANLSEGIEKPLREREAFKQQQEKELLGLDTQMAGLDKDTAQAELQLAALRAKLAQQAALSPNDRVVGPDGKVYFRARPDARGQQAWVPATGSTNITLKQEGEEAKAVGKFMGEQYGAILKAGIDAPHQIAKYDRLANLLEGIHTGRLTPTFTQLAAFADGLGIKLDPKLGPKQAAEALSNEIALTLRNPAGGAGMPGALSDQDREFLRSMTPGLAKTPEGNRLIIETARKIAERDMDVAKLAREYRKKHGSIDEGFYDELDAFSRAHPLFGKAAAEDAGEEEADEEAALPARRGPPSADEAAATTPGTVSFYDLPKR